MRDLAVLALVSREKGEFLRHQFPLPERVHGEARLRRVAAEEPAEAGTRPVARKAPARNEPAPEVGIADALLLQVDLRPLQGEIEPRIRRLDGDGGGEHRVGPCALGVVQRTGLGDQPIVTGEDLLPGRGSSRHRDRDELPARAFRVDRDHHGARRLAQLMGGVFHGVRGPWRPDDGVRLLQALGEHEGAPLRVPVGVLPTERTRPHVVQHGLELGDDLERFGALHLQQDQEAGEFGGRKDVLAHLKGRVAVGDGRKFGPDVYRARDGATRDRRSVGRGREAEPEPVSDFEGVDPQLRLPGLEAEPRRPGPGHAQVFAGTDGAREFDRRRCDLEARNPGRGLAGTGVRQDDRYRDEEHEQRNAPRIVQSHRSYPHFREIRCGGPPPL